MYRALNYIGNMILLCAVVLKAPTHKYMQQIIYELLHI